MTSQLFYEEGSTLLTPEAFEFVLTRELRRAVRSQNFLTLVVLEAAREWDEMRMTADAGTLQELGQIIATDLRETDPLGHIETGTLALVLLTADVEPARRVIDRLAFRVENYEFATPLCIAVGAACCPVHAVARRCVDRSRPVALDRALAQQFWIDARWEVTPQAREQRGAFGGRRETSRSNFRRI